MVATFGRGFYVMDDYSPLQCFKPPVLEQEAQIFPVRDALMYIQTGSRYGQGSTYFLAPNPPFGATFTYYLKDGIKTQRDQRREKEKELFEKGEKIKVLNPDELREEVMEEKPYLLFTITDIDGNVIKKLTTAPSKGINRITWDLRVESPLPVRTRDGYNPLASGQSGFLVMPDTYRVSMSKVVDGEETLLVEPVSFIAKALNNTTLGAKDRKAMVEFQLKAAELNRKMRGAMNLTNELKEKTAAILQTMHHTPGAGRELIDQAKAVAMELDELLFIFNGHQPKASWEEVPPGPVPLARRLSTMAYGHYSSTSEITQTEKDVYQILMEEFPPVMERITKVANTDIPELEKKLESLRAPWTPGRMIQ